MSSSGSRRQLPAARAAAFAFWLAACVPHTASSPAPAQAPTRQPASSAPSAPLLVVLVVDQLAAWQMTERLSSLSAEGGFARLRREGMYAAELRYEHATTSTAPGHAALFTGLPPRGSGIYANERLQHSPPKVVSILADESSRVVLDGVLEDASSSAAALRVPTLADALRAQRPDARIVALSLKDRGAIPGGGSRPDASVWFDTARSAFVTSTAFATELPAWARAYNAKLGSVLGGSWRALDEAWLREHSPTPDEQPGEGDLGLGIHFPYDLSRASKPSIVFRSTPLADEALLELALAALDDRDTARPRLLSLSLSAFDYVGHVFGPDSWESWEALRRLDLLLARFFEQLERRFSGQLAILLTADHGATVLPETAGNARARPWCQRAASDYFERPCAAGGRLYRDELESSLRKAARAALGDGDWIRGVVEPFVYFTPAALQLASTQRDKLVKACVASLKAYPEVERVVDSAAIRAPCPAAEDDSLDALVCRSLTDGAGELYVITRPGCFFDPQLVRAHGINHGSPYLYDRTVPLFVRTPEHRAAGVALTSSLRPADFTATAAALLGIDPPVGASSGRSVVATGPARR